MARAAYVAVLWLAFPWILLRLWWKGGKEPGYRLDIAERFGLYRRVAPAARPRIWIHAVSLGETRAAQPVFERLRDQFPDHDFLVTYMTATGRQAAAELFDSRAERCWLPYDYPGAMRRFLRHWRPSLGVLMETEVWVNLAREARHAEVPLLLANARLSEKSLRGYQRLGSLASDAFASLAATAAQSEADATRLRALGARRVTVTGNVKFDMQPNAALAALAAELRAGYGSRNVLLLASTREGEEDLLLKALAGAPLDALVVVVPRHPQRFDEVAALLARHAGNCHRRSAGLGVPADCRFVLGDSLGEMPAYYAAADVAFVGGSLLPFGGQNLIEACNAGVPVLIGPHVYNFAEAAREALATGAALQVQDAPAVVAVARELLSDEARRAAMGEAGRTFCARHRGATQRIVALCAELLGDFGA